MGNGIPALIFSVLPFIRLGSENVFLASDALKGTVGHDWAFHGFEMSPCGMHESIIADGGSESNKLASPLDGTRTELLMCSSSFAADPTGDREKGLHKLATLWWYSVLPKSGK